MGLDLNVYFNPLTKLICFSLSIKPICKAIKYFANPPIYLLLFNFINNFILLPILHGDVLHL